MVAPTRFKICPKCNAPTEYDARTCAKCRHAFSMRQEGSNAPGVVTAPPALTSLRTRVEIGKNGVTYRNYPIADNQNGAPPREVKATVDPKETLSALNICRLQSSRYGTTTIVAILGFIAFIFIASKSGDSGGIIGFIAFVCWIAAIAYAYKLALDSYRERSTFELIYDLDDAGRTQQRKINEAVVALTHSQALWQITAEAYGNRKRDGAAVLVDRTQVVVRRGICPANIKTNVDALLLPLVHGSIFFLPDRMYIDAGGKYHMLRYADVHITTEDAPFIETGGVPHDGHLHRHQWLHQNTNGGPDRRYANNPEVPVMLYTEIWMRANDGFRLVLQASSRQAACLFVVGMQNLAKDDLSARRLMPTVKCPNCKTSLPANAAACTECGRVVRL
jgi:ribosomal protein L40E